MTQRKSLNNLLICLSILMALGALSSALMSNSIDSALELLKCDEDVEGYKKSLTLFLSLNAWKYLTKLIIGGFLYYFSKESKYRFVWLILGTMYGVHSVVLFFSYYIHKQFKQDFPSYYLKELGYLVFAYLIVAFISNSYFYSVMLQANTYEIFENDFSFFEKYVIPGDPLIGKSVMAIWVFFLLRKIKFSRWPAILLTMFLGIYLPVLIFLFDLISTNEKQKEKFS